MNIFGSVGENPHRLLAVVAWIDARFGVALSRSTPVSPVGIFAYAP